MGHICDNDLSPKSDSAYVVEGCNVHRQFWRRSGRSGIDNADLWVEVDNLLEARQREGIPVVILKVKGHTKAREGAIVV